MFDPGMKGVLKEKAIWKFYARAGVLLLAAEAGAFNGFLGFID